MSVNNTVIAKIKLRTTAPSDNKLEKGEVYIKISGNDLSIYVGSDERKENNVIDTNIKPTKLHLVNDVYELETFGGFVGSNNGFSSPQGTTKSINNAQLNGVGIAGLSNLIVDTTSGAICGSDVPRAEASVGQIYFQINNSQ